MTPPVEALPVVEGMEAEREMRRISRRSFLWAGRRGCRRSKRAALAEFAQSGQRNSLALRRSLEITEQINRDYFQTARLSPTFPRARAVEPRQNGEYGLDGDVDPDWKLSLAGLPDAEEPMMISLADIKNCRRLKSSRNLSVSKAGAWSCIGRAFGSPILSRITGQKARIIRLANFPAYVGMETPDGAYYVGLDKASAMHPQTLLCYEMNGAALTDEHGAPLRLAIRSSTALKISNGLERFASPTPDRKTTGRNRATTGTRGIDTPASDAAATARTQRGNNAANSTKKDGIMNIRIAGLFSALTLLTLLRFRRPSRRTK